MWARRKDLFASKNQATTYHSISREYQTEIQVKRRYQMTHWIDESDDSQQSLPPYSRISSTKNKHPRHKKYQMISVDSSFPYFISVKQNASSPIRPALSQRIGNHMLEHSIFSVTVFLVTSYSSLLSPSFAAKRRFCLFEDV